MKFTLGWLREHLDTDASLEEITDRLTMIGLEVEGVENKAEELAPFTAARVLKAEQHPNADKLRVCEVEWEGGVEHVVCGAPNARTGMMGVFAPSGSYIPGSGVTLKPTKIRGFPSNGMLVSEREMGLSDEHEGIIELADDTPLGTPLAELLGLDDPVIEIAITPNRPDALGVRGVARDLAAAGLGTLKPDPIEALPGNFPSPIGVSLKFTPETASACSQFIGRYIRGLKNGPSPDWLQRRLRAIGLRPINALVDITNFMSYDRGRPLHVFDADRLKGDIHARLAERGETLPALDGREYTLDETMCAICDDSSVVGIGGVMGGDKTGCTEETRNVFIECAFFDPLRIARTGRELNIVSDARYRFERGVDPAFLPQAMELATRLVLDMCGGEPSDVVNAGQAPIPEREIELPVGEVKRLTGLDIAEDRAAGTLQALGFSVSGKAPMLKVTPPSWRPDIDGKADLVEEIVRIEGLDRVPSTPLPRASAVTRPVLTESQDRMRRARRCLAGRGLHEAATWSFVPRAHAELFGGGNAVEALSLANPISAELDTMRPSVLPGLIAAAGRNIDRAMSHVALFEAGPQFGGLEPEEQTRAVSGLRRGAGPRHWTEAPREPDVFDVKADAFAVLEACGAPVDSVQVTDDAPGWYHPGRSGTLRLGPKTVLAHFGEIHPRVLHAMDVKGPVMAFEIFPEHIPPSKRKPGKARPPLDAPDLLPVERDFAFVVDRGVSADALVRAARGAEKKLIEDVRVFDLYEGAGVPEGKKSLAIEVRLQPREKTLTDEEIEAVSAKIVAQVKKATGGELRG
jgi:phenylalanyl-tRNA synthetase beta chain